MAYAARTVAGIADLAVAAVIAGRELEGIVVATRAAICGAP